MNYQSQNIVDLPRDVMFDILCDVERYQAFVPLCKKSVVLAENAVDDNLIRRKVELHLYHKKYGVDVLGVSDIEIDRRLFSIKSQFTKDGKSDPGGRSVCQLVCLGNDRTRVIFDVEYKSRNMLGMFLPKKPFINMLSQKFLKAAVDYGRILG